MTLGDRFDIIECSENVSGINKSTPPSTVNRINDDKYTERQNLAPPTFFAVPLGAWDGVRYFIVALPEPSI